MTSFVLVHGSGQSAVSWSRVADLLRARGHAVATPELPKRATDWKLMDHARAIADAIDDPRAIVVAHSFSGAFLPLVPAIRECGRLVFLAAVIPEPGKSVSDQRAEDPTMFNDAWIRAGARWFDPIEKEKLGREFLFHDCDQATLPWAYSGMSVMDTRRLVPETSPLERWPDVPCTSIVASQDRTISAEWGRRMTRRVLGAEAIQMEAGHCPHVSRPADVARMLEELAGS